MTLQHEYCLVSTLFLEQLIENHISFHLHLGTINFYHISSNIPRRYKTRWENSLSFTPNLYFFVDRLSCTLLALFKKVVIYTFFFLSKGKFFLSLGTPTQLHGLRRRINEKKWCKPHETREMNEVIERRLWDILMMF